MKRNAKRQAVRIFWHKSLFTEDIARIFGKAIGFAIAYGLQGMRKMAERAW